MCQIISVVTNKGGAGKTSTVEFLSQLLAYMNHRVLVVDLDPQNNLSMALNCYTEDSIDIVNGLLPPEHYNIAAIFRFRYRNEEETKQCIYHPPIHHLDIIPSSKRHRHTLVTLLLNSSGNNKIILKRALAPLRSSYDYILIDNAPADDLITLNSLLCSDLVIAPIRADGFSYEGCKQIMSTIFNIQEEYDYRIPFGGVFITQSEENTNACKNIKKMCQEQLGDYFYRTSIRKDTHVNEINTTDTPILQKFPDTNAVYDYSQLLLELGILDSKSQALLTEAIS